MKSFHREVSTCRSKGSRTLASLLLLFFLTPGMPSSARECLMAVQLKDPFQKATYERTIAAAATDSFRENGSLDPLALRCLSCHAEGQTGTPRYRISDGTLSQFKSIETIRGAHPIGMNYAVAGRNRPFTPGGSLPIGMSLINGNVSCVSCHNLLGSNTSYHVVDNSASGLCFSCHII